MSRGEVWDAATTEPAVGMCVLPALPSDLEGGRGVSRCGGEGEFVVVLLAYPLRTPST
jgi:hypothetical protein